MKDIGDHPPIYSSLKLILALIRVKIRFLRCLKLPCPYKV